MNTFEFDVNDDEGFWGSVRQKANDAAEAEEKCRAWLDDEVENGSVLFGYILTLKGPRS